MKTIIRAEDFDIVGNQLNLGRRVLKTNAIAFARIERRVSAELLGFGVVIIGIFIIAIAVTGQALSFLALTAVAIPLGLGARREIRRPYVLVMEIYQLGIFEVRGFTQAEAIGLHQVIIANDTGGYDLTAGQQSID